jgi:murein DD-endopeptidase MepM/ murein hydrolase activator NlpD
MASLLGLLVATALSLTPARAAVDPVGVWPLDPVPQVVRPFDPPDSPYGAGHRGVDLLGGIGQPVRAALAGTVSWAGSLAGRGVVVVDHGATRTTYEPVVSTVPVGTQVAAGAAIGTLELPQSHCFPRACLHWGWLEGETYLDPLRLVGGGPMRLLPLWRDQPVGYLTRRTGSPPMFAVQVVKSVTVEGKVICTANQQPPRVAGLQL